MTIVNGNAVPQILGNGIVRGCSTMDPFKTRAERIAEFEKKFRHVCLEEMGREITEDTGILSYQIWPYPYGIMIETEPKMTSRQSSRVLYDEHRVCRMPVAFVSRSYWFDGKKVEFLVDGETVLDRDVCDIAAAKVAACQGWEAPEYQDIWICRIDRSDRPYRVYGCGEHFLFFDLLNGVVLTVKEKELPVFRIAERRFSIGRSIHFSVDARGNILRN